MSPVDVNQFCNQHLLFPDDTYKHLPLFLYALMVALFKLNDALHSLGIHGGIHKWVLVCAILCTGTCRYTGMNKNNLFNSMISFHMVHPTGKTVFLYLLCYQLTRRDFQHNYNVLYVLFTCTSKRQTCTYMVKFGAL